MAYSYRGGIFTCKICEYTHIIPWECIPKDKRRTINVPCMIISGESRKYRGYEFKEWHGTWDEYSGNIVKPTSDCHH